MFRRRNNTAATAATAAITIQRALLIGVVVIAITTTASGTQHQGLAVVHAQFTCTFSGSQNSADCIAMTDDGNDHCVWCTVGGDTQSSDTAVSHHTTTVTTGMLPRPIKDFGFCVSELQAEAMEKSIPSLHCDRYASTDDATPPPPPPPVPDDDTVPPETDDSTPPPPETDDNAPPPETDDSTPPPPETDDITPPPPETDDITPPPPETDDITPPPPETDDTTPPPPETDDSTPPPPETDDTTPPNTDDHVDPNPVPDNFWTCLQKKTAATCIHANCTWCNTKGGFPLCMTGPTAESASHSDWFTCHNTTNFTNTVISEQFHPNHQQQKLDTTTSSNIIDLSCVTQYEHYPTANECMTSYDNVGKNCRWCTMMDMTTLCLSSEQVDIGRHTSLGLSCENDEEEEINTDFVAVVGFEAVEDRDLSNNLKDVYDVSCVLASIEDNTANTCISTVDANGNSCHFCTLLNHVNNGHHQFNMCLTTDQANIGMQQFGVTCDSTITAKTIITDENHEAITAIRDDPYDPSCVLAYLQDQSKDACIGAVDEDGTPCEFCSLQGAFDLCLTAEQAQMSEQLGITCDTTSSTKSNTQKEMTQDTATSDPADPSCVLAYIQDPSKETCISAIDKDGTACEFCSLQGVFDMCVTSEQAQVMEQLGVTCDETIMTTMTTENTRLAVKDDPYDPSCVLAYLQDQSKEACVGAVDEDGSPCEFCSLQGAFDLCLTSEQAQMSEQLGITCDEKAEIVKNDPYDPSCVLAYLQDQSKEACVGAVDEDGSPCEFCSLQGAFDLCLTSEQAQMSEQLGITCDEKAEIVKDDPYDPSCVLAYLQDQSKEACVGAVDEDGAPCEFCSLQGAFDLCLTSEQAQMSEQLGITCDEKAEIVKDDPYDPSCVLAYLQDQSKEACVGAVDEDGAPCEFCSLQGAFDLCLTTEQAQMSEQLGITCDENHHTIDIMSEAKVALVGDPYDQSCIVAYWADQSPDECIATIDTTGKHCQYCSLPGAFVMCLSSDQAEIGQALGMECKTSGDNTSEIVAVQAVVQDPYDINCAMSYLQTPTKEACVASMDSDGNACEFCNFQGSDFNMCLTQEQASIGHQIGMACESASSSLIDSDNQIQFPDDFFECLEHYEEDDCRNSPCTWCNTQVGMGFCLAKAAVEATKQCSFFDCEFEQPVRQAVETDILDPLCLKAGIPLDSETDVSTICAETNDSNGDPCVWCDAPGDVFGLCLQFEQADAASIFLQCKHSRTSVVVAF